MKIKRSKREYQTLKEFARALVHHKLEHFNAFYNFSYNRVSIKNMKTRWGSCSTKKNLNFHYKIIELPTELADYLIVHELCHLGEFNHSDKFWILVEKTIPHYKTLRTRLRAIHF